MAKPEEPAITILAQLQLILLSSQQMQAFAEAEQWDRLINEDQRRLQLQGVLQSYAWPDESWSSVQRERAGAAGLSPGRGRRQMHTLAKLPRHAPRSTALTITKTSIAAARLPVARAHAHAAW